MGDPRVGEIESLRKKLKECVEARDRLITLVQANRGGGEEDETKDEPNYYKK